MSSQNQVLNNEAGLVSNKEKINELKTRFSNLKEIKQVKPHQAIILAICLTSDGRIASCSYDNTIKIINPETLETEMTITGHTSHVFNICLLNNGCLASCSYDNTIRIWDIKQTTYNCVKEINAHEASILKVEQISNNRMISCSWDKTVKVWQSNPPYDLIHTIAGHSGEVRGVFETKNHKYIVSGGGFDEKNIKFWDSEYKEVAEIKDVLCYYGTIFFEYIDNKIIVGEDNQLLVIVNVLTFQVENKIQLDHGVCSALNFGDSIVLFGDREGGFLLEDIIEKKQIFFKEGLHEADIDGFLMLSEHRFATCSHEAVVKLWEI